MNKYIITYKTDERWVAFGIKAPDMYEALDWTHNNIQDTSLYIQPFYG